MSAPTPLRRASIAAVWLCGAAFLAAGCVSKKYQAASALGGQPAPLNASLAGASVAARLDAVVVYQGPGSWKKSAYWDEFMVTFANESDAPVTLTAAGLVDYFGTVMTAGSDPWKLEQASQLQRDRYLKAGVNFALNTLGYAAFTYSAAGAGAFIGATMTNTWGGMATGATVGLVAVPVTAIVVYVNNQKHRQAIEREFNRRRLVLPLQLGPGESRSGSLFFPMAVSPQSFRLECSRATGPETCLLPLPMLAGLHRKGSPAAAVNSPAGR